MIESRSRFFSFVLLLGGLITCSCQQSSSDNKEHPLDFSNPAVSLSYETEEVPQGEFISCGDQHLRLRIRPFGGDYLTNNEKRNDRQLAELVRKFVLNPENIPHLAASTKQAYIRLIDLHEGETSWRGSAIRAIRVACSQLWDDAARNGYSKEYAMLPRWQKECILNEFPLSIDMAGPWIIPPTANG
jgi:hypothetical protein